MRSNLNKALYRVGNANGTSTYYGYDNRDRVSWIEHHSYQGRSNSTMSGQPEAAEERHDYTYDKVGNMLSYYRYVAGSGTNTVRYSYDPSNRLTYEQNDGTIQNQTPVTTTYNYDPNNNRSSVKRGSTTSTYTYYNWDKLRTGDGFTINGYDNNGSPTGITAPNGVTSTFAYDAENRIKSIAYSNGTAGNTFTYNGDGLRVGKTDSTGTTTYVYDGTNLIADIVNGTWRYELPGIGFTSNGAHTYDRNSALGSQIASTNDASTVTSVTDYDAFGVTLPIMGTKQGILGFAGKHGYQSDDDSGLQLLGHRYYAPMLVEVSATSFSKESLYPFDTFRGKE